MLQKKHDNFAWKCLRISSGKLTYYGCKSHHNCSKIIIIKKNENNLWAAYENDDIHSSILYSESKDESGESGLRGVKGNARIMCENHFNQGCGPKGIHARLILFQSKSRGSTKPNETLSKIPSFNQVRRLCLSFRRQGLGDININLDLMEWASPRMCLSKDNLDMRWNNNSFEMLVLSKPLARTVLVDEKDCK